VPRGPRGEALVGDLREEYDRRAASEGEGDSAAAWYRREAGAIGVRYALRSLKTHFHDLIQAPFDILHTRGVLTDQSAAERGWRLRRSHPGVINNRGVVSRACLTTRDDIVRHVLLPAETAR
jgi:hypothetical protein